jgi:hypothetical protein
MGISPSGAVAVPLTVFGGEVTQVPAESLPENVSPACPDMFFTPGQTFSRPGLDKQGTALPAGGVNNYIPTVVYEKSFVTPTGDIKNLFFDSNGALWVTDLSTGIRTLLLQSTPGCYCKSITAFGREYIAISDGHNGQEVPLQYDGIYLDRLTSDAPGAAPSVVMMALPAVNMASAGGSSPTITVTLAQTNNPITVGPPSNPHTIYSGVVMTVTSTAGFSVGQSVFLAGNSNSALNISYTIIGISGLSIQCVADFANFEGGSGGTLTGPVTTITMTRANNQVTVTLAANTQVIPGNQVLIAGAGSLAIGSGIASIVINNEDDPGLATVTTNAPHGLIPGIDVTITGVTPSAVGSGIVTAVRQGDTVTLTTSAAHGLVPGSVIQVAGVTDASFDTTTTVALVPSPTQLVYSQTDTDSSSSGGTVSITWPIPDDTPTPTYFTIESAPTAVTFQIQVTYSDGSWSSGAIGFPWDGTFYVTAVPNGTTVVYQQYGPPGTNSTVGTLTPYGQMAPGLHLCAVAGLDRQGGITALSPFTTFIANGGQYPVISNICTLPSNFVARILVFSGAQPNVPGELPPLFYLPAAPQLEGQVVGTATQINDNTTTSVTLDFSDNSLYAGLGVSIPGNTLANQIVLDGALGFGFFGSRLTTWGQRNTVQNLLNMGFDGGPNPLITDAPSGWAGTALLTTGRFGDAAIFTGTYPFQAAIYQQAYLDQYGDPILQPNTLYSVRAYVTGTGFLVTFGATISSASTGFSTSLGTLTSTGNWIEGTFTAKTPLTIPYDIIFEITITPQSGAGSYSAVVDEISLIYAESPTIPDVAYGSYVNNPAGMDGESGQFGPVDDTHAIMDMGIIRDTLYILTQDPSGRLHETAGSGQTEPDGWTVSQVAANCGSLSAFGLTHSQADDQTGSGGDDWMAWPSETGVMMFGGGIPEKVSQEIQPDWYDPSSNDPSRQINMAAAYTIWGVNDPVQRIIFFGLPLGTATAASIVRFLDYKNLNTAAAIIGSPPFHPSFAGKLIATDNSRKWGRILRPLASAARMYLTPNELSLVFGSGNGLAPGTAASYGNIYTLNPAILTDSDYGQISPYYTTYFYMDPEKAQALQLAGGRLFLSYILAYIQGTGQITATYFPDSLSNPWALTTTRTLTTPFYKDRNFGGGMCNGERIAIRFASSPVTGTDNGFVLSRLTAFLKNAKIKWSGVNQ